MGISEDSIGPVVAELTCANKPRERQFQVVHVPGAFTRGRWKCWDYRGDNPPIDAGKLLSFDDSNSDKENDAAGSTSITALSEPLQPSNQSPQREESSTILVTSIAPAPPTPQHGTPSSLTEIPSPPYGVAEVDGPRAGSSGGRSVAPSSPTAPSQQVHVTVAPSASAAASAVSPPVAASAPELTKTAQEHPEEEQPAATATSNAIDNKIEQAMDLVKTHLTFAVREEVEILRSTIADLEAKVFLLEQQNAQLRRYVPQEVLAALPTLIAQHKQSAPATAAPNPQLLVQQVQASQGAAASSLSAPPPAPPSSTVDHPLSSVPPELVSSLSSVVPGR